MSGRNAEFLSHGNRNLQRVESSCCTSKSLWFALFFFEWSYGLLFPRSFLLFTNRNPLKRKREVQKKGTESMKDDATKQARKTPINHSP